MKTSTHRPTVIGGFVLLLALAVSAFFVFRAVGHLFAHLDAQVTIVSSVAALVIFLSAAVIAAAIRQRRGEESVHPMSGERGALYDRMLKVWAMLLAENRSLADETVRASSADMAALESRLALIASPEVIKAYLSLRAATGKNAQQNGDLRGHLKRLMVAMRRDLVGAKPDVDGDELLSVLISKTNLPAAQMERKADFPAARSPEDLRPPISLAAHP